MTTGETIEEGVQLLQELGLKEYEARSFVGLIRIKTGTAKKLSKLTKVPRTRVYDALRVLESKGLVEVQYSSPRRYRAVSLQDAAETLRDQYADRVHRLQTTLETVERADIGRDDATEHQVWSVSGSDAIENRTEELIETAATEVLLIIGDASVVTDSFIASLNALENEVDLLIGTVTASLQDRIQDRVPEATTFTSGLEWLHAADPHKDDTTIGRLLLVDRSAILVSIIKPATAEEQAIFGEGFENGLVGFARRLMADGLSECHDSGE